jgi:ketosteroid isomerase-like protein
MMAGDSGPWKALVTPGDDVMVLGAFGGYGREHAAVDANFDRAAGAYGGGSSSYEELARWVGADLACTVGLEHHEARLAGREPTRYTYWVTHVLRREGADWRIVLRHADPLPEYCGATSVLPDR